MNNMSEICSILWQKEARYASGTERQEFLHKGRVSLRRSAFFQAMLFARRKVHLARYLRIRPAWAASMLLLVSPPSGATCLQQQVRQEREPSRMGLDLRDLKSGFFDEVGSVPIPMTIAEQARRHRDQRILHVCKKALR